MGEAEVQDQIKIRSTSEKSTNVMGERMIQTRCPPHRHPSRHIPRQDAADHSLMSWRRRSAEEVAIVTVLLREIHSETKTKVGSTTAKAPALRTNPKIDETPTTPKRHTHPSVIPPGNPPTINPVFIYLRTSELFIITEKTRGKERKWYGVGIMKDKELKLEDVKTPHTLGWTSYILFEYIDPTEVGADISLPELFVYDLFIMNLENES